jgi:DMSO/TMAO reductase YedYZ heme-binding membrane subunit
MTIDWLLVAVMFVSLALISAIIALVVRSWYFPQRQLPRLRWSRVHRLGRARMPQRVD